MDHLPSSGDGVWEKLAIQPRGRDRPDRECWPERGRRPVGTEGAASVVYLDDVAGERMWGYLQTDSLSQNAEEFSTQALPDVPR